jgi:ABC-type nitrate/sulfonate/bicarbonate transport system permease component
MRDLRAWLLPVVLLLVWEIAGRVMATDSFAPPSAAAFSGVDAVVSGELPIATLQTLAAAVGGFLVGAGLAVPAGALLGLLPRLDLALDAPIEMLRPLPSVALIPLSLMVFGFGLRMEVAIVAFATFWPMLVLTRSAVAGVDRMLLDVGRALEMGLAMRIVKLVLPAALPRIVVALRLCLGVALVVAVTVEIAANPQGLGYGLVIAQQSLKPALMLAHVVWIGVVGFLLNAALLSAERWIRRRRGDIAVMS